VHMRLETQFVTYLPLYAINLKHRPRTGFVYCVMCDKIMISVYDLIIV